MVTLRDDVSALRVCPACDHDVGAEDRECPRCGGKIVTVTTVDPNLGRVLQDRYEIRDRLGVGGMGTVYRAWQRSTGREVAMKLIHHSHRHEQAWIRRFLREAHLASQFHHPHTVTVLDFGQAAEGDLFLVMELVRGRTLAEVVAADGALGVERTVRVGVQICDALSAAHARSIVHRDLKPQNVMVLDEPAGRDFVKLLDFGLARSFASEGRTETQLAGSPWYMAPEVLAGEPPGPASDIYSLGVVLAEAHLGRPLFVGDDPAALLHEKAHFIELPSGIEAPLAQVLRALLEPNPERRPRSASQVREQLEVIRPLPARRPRRRLLGLVAAVIVIAVAAGALVAAARRRTVSAASGTCGTGAVTYLVDAGAGVRCVQLHPGGGLTWYGAGVVATHPYHQFGEGQLGGDATWVPLADEATSAPTTVRVRALPGASARDGLPERLAVGEEVWVRAGTSQVVSPVESPRACGTGLVQYRVYARDDDKRGLRLRCVRPAGGTWIGWDDGQLEMGQVASLRARAFPGVGAGFEQDAPGRGLWLPTVHGHAVRLHAMVRPGGPTSAQVARWVARANERLALIDLQVLYIDDPDGPDYQPIAAADMGDRGNHLRRWAARANQLAATRPTKIVVFFDAAASDECKGVTSNDFISMTPDGHNSCNAPPDELLDRLIERFLGVYRTFGPGRPISAFELGRLSRRLIGRGYE
jgi:hypothetical protein